MFRNISKCYFINITAPEALNWFSELSAFEEEELLNAAERYDSAKISFELHLTELTKARLELFQNNILSIQLPLRP